MSKYFSPKSTNFLRQHKSDVLSLLLLLLLHIVAVAHCCCCTLLLLLFVVSCCAVGCRLLLLLFALEVFVDCCYCHFSSKNIAFALPPTHRQARATGNEVHPVVLRIIRMFTEPRLNHDRYRSTIYVLFNKGGKNKKHTHTHTHTHVFGLEMESEFLFA